MKLTITNYPEGQSEVFQVENNPNDPEAGSREVTFSRNLWIEADDFLAQPIPKYKRLYPDGPECRLKGAYLIKCTGCVKDANGNVTEILCTYDNEYSEMLMDVRVYRMAAGEKRTFCREGEEIAVLLLSGKIEWFLCDSGETKLEGNFVI